MSKNSSFVISKFLYSCGTALQDLIHNFDVPNHLMWHVMYCCISFVILSGTTQKPTAHRAPGLTWTNHNLKPYMYAEIRSIIL